jgi:hypothetical protein
MSARNKKERFGFARYHARLQGLREITLLYEGDSAIIHVRPPDISASGMFISTNRVLPEGAIVSVQCKLAHSGAAVRARGEVRYCLRGVGVGIEFTDISPEAVRAIERRFVWHGGDHCMQTIHPPKRKAGQRAAECGADAYLVNRFYF